MAGSIKEKYDQRQKNMITGFQGLVYFMKVLLWHHHFTDKLFHFECFSNFRNQSYSFCFG